MLSHYFKMLQMLFGEPIYVFHRGTAGMYCDKMTEPKDNQYRRTRYVITGTQQCTCLGWMKSEPPRSCKHLKMLAGDYSWVRGDGCGPDYVRRALDEIVEHSEKALPASVKHWLTPEATERLVPDTGVVALSLSIRDSLTKPFTKIVAPKKFADNKVLMVEFVYEIPEKEKTP